MKDVRTLLLFFGLCQSAAHATENPQSPELQTDANSEVFEQEAGEWPWNITFSKDIKPILDNSCTECHSHGSRKPDLSTFPFVYRDGDDQATIVTRIIARASQATMPPGARTKLTPGQIALIQTWLEEGLNP